MPTYEYECKHCGHNFELIQSMSAEPAKICPECGKEVKRLIGGGMGIFFKGSGFYATDSRSSSSAYKTDKKASETDKSDTKTEKSPATSDSKSAEKGKKSELAPK